MNNELLKLLLQQILIEFDAAKMYEILANRCNILALEGFESFFRKNSDEEKTHARIFMKYILARGIYPEIINAEGLQDFSQTNNS